MIAKLISIAAVTTMALAAKPGPAATTLDRRDFGVSVGDWAATMVVGRDVAIEIVLEAALRD